MAAMSKLVSVIMIFLNAEKFLQEAIESVLAQTYDHWELLLVDDGSTDGSTRMALHYATQYPGRVSYLTHAAHQNRGMSASRNLGIAHAKGDYIAFLDADDVWLPAKLAQQVALLQAHPEAAMLYGRTQLWYSWTGNPADLQRDHMLPLGVQPNTLVQPPTLLLHFWGGNVQTPTTCNALIRREVFTTIGGFQNTFRGMYEDQVFFTKVCLTMPVFVADAYWARYRQHPESCCAIAEKTGEMDTAWRPFLQWVASYLTEHGIHDSQVWRALRRQLQPYRHPLRYHLKSCSWQFSKRLNRLAKRTLPAPAYTWLEEMCRAVVREAH
jgi:glycosyltransferase involved in cell wall biosynthesis